MTKEAKDAKEEALELIEEIQNNLKYYFENENRDE